jgi:hypothetical protein
MADNNDESADGAKTPATKRTSRTPRSPHTPRTATRSPRVDQSVSPKGEKVKSEDIDKAIKDLLGKMEAEQQKVRGRSSRKGSTGRQSRSASHKRSNPEGLVSVDKSQAVHEQQRHGKPKFSLKQRAKQVVAEIANDVKDMAKSAAGRGRSRSRRQSMNAERMDEIFVEAELHNQQPEGYVTEYSDAQVEHSEPESVVYRKKKQALRHRRERERQYETDDSSPERNTRNDRDKQQLLARMQKMRDALAKDEQLLNEFETEDTQYRSRRERELKPHPREVIKPLNVHDDNEQTVMKEIYDHDMGPILMLIFEKMEPKNRPDYKLLASLLANSKSNSAAAKRDTRDVATVVRDMRLLGTKGAQIIIAPPAATTYSVGPALTGPRGNATLKLCSTYFPPNKGKFIPGDGKNTSKSGDVCEALAFLTRAQNKCRLSREEFLEKFMDYFVGPCSIDIMEWIEANLSIEDIYKRMIRVFYKGETPAEAENTLKFIKEKHMFASMAEAEVKILRLARIASYKHMDVTQRIKDREHMASEAFLSILPPMVRTLVIDHASRVRAIDEKDLNFQDYIEMCSHHQDETDFFFKRRLEQKQKSPNGNNGNNGNNYNNSHGRVQAIQANTTTTQSGNNSANAASNNKPVANPNKGSQNQTSSGNTSSNGGGGGNSNSNGYGYKNKNFNFRPAGNSNANTSDSANSSGNKTSYSGGYKGKNFDPNFVHPNAKNYGNDGQQQHYGNNGQQQNFNNGQQNGYNNQQKGNFNRNAQQNNGGSNYNNYNGPRARLHDNNGHGNSGGNAAKPFSGNADQTQDAQAIHFGPNFKPPAGPSHAQNGKWPGGNGQRNQYIPLGSISCQLCPWKGHSSMNCELFAPNDRIPVPEMCSKCEWGSYHAMRVCPMGKWKTSQPEN